MAVVSVKPVPRNQSGKESLSDGVAINTYSLTFIVDCDDPGDDWSVIKSHDDLPQVAETYDTGAATDADSYCISRNCTRAPKSMLRHIVVCEFTDEKGAIEGIGGGPKDVEVLAATFKEVSVQKVLKKAIVKRAEFLGVYDVNLEIIDGAPLADGFEVGKEQAITNSVGVPRIVEDDEYLHQYRIRKYATYWDQSAAETYENTINSDAFTIYEHDDFGIKGVYTFKPFTARMIAVQSNPIRTQEKISASGAVGVFDRLYYEIIFEILHYKKTWRHLEQDSGRVVLAVEGEPDSMGGTWGQDPVEEGVPPVRELVDTFGTKLSGEELLDGAGALLDPREPQGEKNLGWKIKEEIPFAPLQL